MGYSFIFRCLAVALFAMILSGSQVFAQPSFNGGFERYDRSNYQPALWEIEGDSRTITDTTVFHNGEASLKIASNRIGKDRMKGYPTGLATTDIIPISKLKNKRCRISGYIKTQDVLADSNTYRVGFYAKMYDNNGRNFFMGLSDSTFFRGTHDWNLHTFEFVVPDSAASLSWGVSFIGTGTVWFDDISFAIDGKLVHDTQIEQPSPQEIAWLRKHIVPLRSDIPSQSNAGLEALKKEIGTSKVIGLDEATHGTSEFFTTKHRLLEYFASEMNVGVFAMEAYMPEAYKVNDYVLNGKGTPEECVYGMKFWTWRNEEVVNLIKWMKDYNDRHTKKIRFDGFDMQSYKQALENIRAFVLQSDTTLLSEFNTLNKNVELVETATQQGTISTSSLTEAIQNAQIIYSRLSSTTPVNKPSTQKERIIQDCRIVLQALKFKVRSLGLTELRSVDALYRDSCMAENIRWIAEQTNPKERVVIWAHNAHITKNVFPNGELVMGTRLSRTFGKNYYALGFSCGKGFYTAYNYDSNKVVRNNTLVEPYLGTFEEYFRAAGITSGILFSNQITSRSPLAQWLTTPFKLRDIGSLAGKNQYSSCMIPDSFDALIYIANTTSSQLLPPRLKK